MTPSSDMRDRVLALARAQPSPTRDERRGRARAVAVMSVGVPIVIWVAIGVIAPLPRGYIVATGAGFLVALGITLGLALWRGPSLLGPPTRWLALASGISGPAILAWVVLAAYAYGLDATPSPFGAHAICFVFSNLLAAAPLAGLVWARRGTDPVHPRATGAVLGAAAGAAGGLLMQLHCPWGSPLPAALGHALPMIVLTVAGALFVGRLVGVERR